MSKELADSLKALSDEVRLAMVMRILKAKELSCRELMAGFSLSQPTVSHHVGKLMDANVLLVRKEGTAHFYSVNTSFLAGLGIDLKKFVRAAAVA